MSHSFISSYDNPYKVFIRYFFIYFLFLIEILKVWRGDKKKGDLIILIWRILVELSILICTPGENGRTAGTAPPTR